MSFAGRLSRRRLLALAVVVAGPLAAVPATALAGNTAQTTVVGTVVRAYVEHGSRQDAGADTDFGAPLTWVSSRTGAPLRVPTGALAHVPLGATVSVTVGAPVVDTPSKTDHLKPAQQVVASAVLAPAPASATTGTGTTAAGTTAGATFPAPNTVSLALVAPAGSTPDSTTVSQLAGQVTGPVAQYWAGQSQGAISLAVADTHDWLSATADCSDPFVLWREVAGRIGFTPGPGKHLLLYVPNADTQCALGLAQIGSGISDGGYLYVRDLSASVIGHEFGHNFGLLHSGRQECQGSVEGGPCSTAEYGDIYDVMGASWSQVGSLDAPQAARIGLLPADQVQAVGTSGGSYTLAPLSATSGTRALRLTTAAGTTYYLEYRAPSGQDAYLGTSANTYGLRPGVLLHRAETGSPADSSILLDATPTPTAGYASDTDDVFPLGVAVPLPGGVLTLTVTGTGPAGASVVARPVPPPPAPAGGSGPSADIGGSGARYFLSNAFGGPADQVFDYGAPSDATFVGDWDGDGVKTLMLRRGNAFYVRNSNSTGIADVTFSYGDPGDTVLVGDWDGNGTTTLAVRRGNTYYVRNTLSSGVADVVFSYGDPADTVLVGDWDGDRSSTLAVRRGNQYFVRNSLTSGVADVTFSYGEPTDTVLVGRWSAGQAGSSLAVRRGNVYYLRYSLSSGAADSVVAYGDASDTAFPGDWNGDGVDTLGVRRAG